MIAPETSTALFESDAIVEYLDDMSTPLQPTRSPEEKALDRAWSYQAAKHYLTQCATMRSADESAYLKRKSQLAALWAKAEKQLEAGPFFKGDTLSNVDIAWLPLLHRSAIIEECSGHNLLEGYPKVQRWQQALLDTGLARQSVAQDFTWAFTNFYLSEKTFLGTGRNCGDTADKACASGGCC